MVSLTSATVGLRDQPVEFADDGGDLRLEGRLIGGGGGDSRGGPVRPVGQGLFDAAQRAFDTADGQTGFVEIVFHAQALPARGEARNRLSSPPTSEERRVGHKCVSTGRSRWVPSN